MRITEDTQHQHCNPKSMDGIAKVTKQHHNGIVECHRIQHAVEERKNNNPASKTVLARYLQ